MEFQHVEKYPNTIYKPETHNMFLRSKKKVEKPIDVKKTVNELESEGLKCQEEDEELQKLDIIKMGNLQVGKTYELQNPYSYGPYIEERINGERVVHTTERVPKWIIGDEEKNFNDYGIGNEKKYTITSIQYECKKYGRRMPTPKYNIGIFVYLIPQKNDSNDNTSQLKMSYELQTNNDKRAKYKGWKGNTQKTYNDFLEQFKEVSKATATNTIKRIRSSSSSASRKTKRGGKKTEKRKKTQKNRGGMKAQDKKFFENKKKKIQGKVATANLFGYRQSPERNPQNMISSDEAKGDPYRIKIMQSNFNKQMEDEEDFMDAEAAGLTFN